VRRGDDAAGLGAGDYQRDLPGAHRAAAGLASEAASRPASTSTVARGLLNIGAMANGQRRIAVVLLDAAGRKVLELQAGPNDVRRLAPGVYFVRQEPQASSRKPQAVSKVIIAQ